MSVAKNIQQVLTHWRHTRRIAFFTDLFARDWKSERDPKDDSIFIDRNGKLFAHILEYLRTGVMPNSGKNNESL